MKEYHFQNNDPSTKVQNHYVNELNCFVYHLRNIFCTDNLSNKNTFLKSDSPPANRCTAVLTHAINEHHLVDSWGK